MPIIYYLLILSTAMAIYFFIAWCIQSYRLEQAKDDLMIERFSRMIAETEVEELKGRGKI